MDEMIQEFDRVKENSFRLNFIYPDEAKRKELRTINRDLTRAEQEKLSKKVSDLRDVVNALDQGEVKLEDLPTSLRAQLLKVLGAEK